MLLQKKKNEEDADPSPIPSTSKELLYETSKQGFIPGIGGDDNDVAAEE